MSHQFIEHGKSVDNTPIASDSKITETEQNMMIREHLSRTSSSSSSSLSTSSIGLCRQASLSSKTRDKSNTVSNTSNNDKSENFNITADRREKLEQLQKECNKLIQELDLPKNSHKESELIVKKHIQQLKQYNELKDVALSLVSLIADQKQVRIKDILEEMEISPDDN